MKLKKLVPALALTAAALTAVAAPALAGRTTTPSSYKVVAWNDLGMHCACPTFAGFLLLPPFNTVRAQVLGYGSNDPVIIDSTNAGTYGVTVSYAMADNTEATLQADPYFQQWITYAPKLFPGFVPVSGGKVQGLAGNGISGNMTYDTNLKDWTAVGIPAYPLVDANTAKNIMTDPLGGANRNPYPMTNVYVKNASGTILAQTSTVTPVAFGGCCSCHLSLAAANGYPATSAGSFAYLGKMHGMNSSKIDFNYLDPTGDGTSGPIRCSWCHWDPAMGETAAPGLANVWPNYVIMAGAGFTKADVKVSQYSFSDVLHRFHSQSTKVLTQYDANVATNCYDCHPGNNVNCYRGSHKAKTALWCVDCHGNLNQRTAAGQLTQPWKASTLPSCTAASAGANPAFACHATNTVNGTVYPTNPSLFGKFINGRGHKGSIKCQTCHGSAHAEAPSTMTLDNTQLSNLQGSTSYSFPAGKDKTYALGVCVYCHPTKTSTWGTPPHL
ncbi:hypothetical protein [Geomonas oryzae]|uniref:hypothetical protein n=1 Tax=Geomonas oryzae TaxID=2364273 RepID=UPI00100B90ED|nr:hypothetical protein [Geomonas oryzae]